MDQSPFFNVTTLIDIGLNANEHYVQFVPPSTFGVIYNWATKEIYLIRANGARSKLRRAADKIYILRGFIGLRQRENMELELGSDIQDDIIRNVLFSFGTLEKLLDAVWKHCPFAENADIITNVWASTIFANIKGIFSYLLRLIRYSRRRGRGGEWNGEVW